MPHKVTHLHVLGLRAETSSGPLSNGPQPLLRLEGTRWSRGRRPRGGELLRARVESFREAQSPAEGAGDPVFKAGGHGSLGGRDELRLTADPSAPWVAWAVITGLARLPDGRTLSHRRLVPLLPDGTPGGLGVVGGPPFCLQKHCGFPGNLSSPPSRLPPSPTDHSFAHCLPGSVCRGLSW